MKNYLKNNCNYISKQAPSSTSLVRKIVFLVISQEGSTIKQEKCDKKISDYVENHFSKI
jgi:hypothetical protein